MLTSTGLTIEWSPYNHHEWLELRRWQQWRWLASQVSIAENVAVNNQYLGRILDTKILRAAAFDNLLGSEKVVPIFATWIGELAGLLRATLEAITVDLPSNADPSTAHDEHGAASVVSGRALPRRDPWMTGTGTPGPEPSDCMVELASFMGEPLVTRPSRVLLPSSPHAPPFWILKVKQIRTSITRVPTDNWTFIPARHLEFGAMIRNTKNNTLAQHQPTNHAIYLELKFTIP